MGASGGALTPPPRGGSNITNPAVKQIPISPFSYRQGYNLTWNKLDTRWTGIENPHELPVRVKEIVSLVDQVEFITGVQIAKTFWPKNKNDAKKTLVKLEKFGVLVRHNLKNTHRDMPFYTLGPAGAKLVEKPYQINNWLKYKSDYVLKQLIINQLFLRIYRTSGHCQFISAPHPLSGIIVFNDIEFPVIVIRGDHEDMAREIRWLELKKAFVICEDYEQVDDIADEIRFPVRYTTDYELCTVPLNQAFYTWEKGKLEREDIELFDEHT